MKRGKAAGLDELTIDHLVHSHPVLVAILSKFLNLILCPLKADVRQEGVLSPILFSIYIDDLVNLVNKTNIGCKIGAICILVYLCMLMS